MINKAIHGCWGIWKFSSLVEDLARSLNTQREIPHPRAPMYYFQCESVAGETKAVIGIELIRLFHHPQDRPLLKTRPSLIFGSIEQFR